jgi:hypothetical protein
MRSRVDGVGRRGFLLALLLAGCAGGPGRESPRPASDFVCPKCGAAALKIRVSLEFPPDGWSDEISLQAIRCEACRFPGVAVYEESRRGDRERWHHYGYEMKPADYERFYGLLSRCPAPGNRRCSCEAHREYGEVENDTWVGLKRVPTVGKPFDMRFPAKGGPPRSSSICARI